MAEVQSRERNMKHPAKLLAAAAAALLAFAMLASAAQARTPAPGYAQFAGCPSPEENPSIVVCARSTVKSGHFKVGNREVPIEHPVTLSGGTRAGLEGFAYNSKGGLQAVKQKIPGGVIGLTGLTFLLELLGSEALTLYGVTELAGEPHLSLGGEISLPLKVHLINSVLGSKCYVGSSSNPVSVHLITGTTSPPPPNEPISGVEPKFGFDPETEIFTFNGGTYVDNSFAAPGASGCVLTLFGFIPISINGLVNSTTGLPAAAGTNETVQDIDAEFVEFFHVYP
jgi:hypothetical protein